jgi:hypothetical protein
MYVKQMINCLFIFFCILLAIQPICDLIVLCSKTPDIDTPSECTLITDFTSKPINVNTGFLKTPIWIGETRMSRRKASNACVPITAIDVILLDKITIPKPGFTLVPGIVHKTHFGKNVAICVER